MKKQTNFISWIIIGVTLPVMATLAWNQFNWLQELQSREKSRIEFSMVSSAQALSKRLQEEILFLPSLLRLRKEENAEINSIFSERYRFWQYYALFPSMVTDMYLIDSSKNALSKWKDDRFVPSTDAERLTGVLSGLDGTKQGESGIAETDAEIHVFIPIYDAKDSRKMLLCVFDKEVLFSELVPSLAEMSLASTDTYAYRILNAQTGATVYASLTVFSNGHFDNPDIEIPVFEQVHLPSFRKPPDFLTGRLPEKYYESFSFIKERTEGETLPGKKGEQLFPYLILQIVNRDGSLETLSRQATVQNALISFGVVVILALVMIMLSEATRRSRALARGQQEFIATITHELKTPLAVISSAAQNLSDGLIREQKKVESYGSMIRKEATRLGISIEHFLLYSNINSVSRIRTTLCDVKEILEAALKFTEEERAKGEFRTEILMGDEPLFITGDRLALESVFQNLLQNAIKHAGAGKYLGIIVSFEEETGKKRGQRVIIKIRDKGPGISSREQKLIFEPFTRGKRAIDGQIPGNGIGLNLVKRIVTVHNGTIKLESKLDQGSTFIVSLPASKGV